MFARAEIGTPDGTDVASRFEPLIDPQRVFLGVFRSVVPTAIAHGITSELQAAAWTAAIARAAARHPDQPALWPLLIGACKRKERA
jgi:hypothetical protein